MTDSLWKSDDVYRKTDFSCVFTLDSNTQPRLRGAGPGLCPPLGAWRMGVGLGGASFVELTCCDFRIHWE